MKLSSSIHEGETLITEGETALKTVTKTQAPKVEAADDGSPSAATAVYLRAHGYDPGEGHEACRQRESDARSALEPNKGRPFRRLQFHVRRARKHPCSAALAESRQLHELDTAKEVHQGGHASG